MASTMPKQMADRLKQLRIDHHLSFEQVGKVVGRSGNTVRSWEACTAAVQPRMLMRLAEFYNVPIQSFYYPDEEYAEEYTEDERFIVKRYRDMSPLDKRLLYRIAFELSERSAEYAKRLEQYGVDPEAFYSGIDLEGGLK